MLKNQRNKTLLQKTISTKMDAMGSLIGKVDVPYFYSALVGYPIAFILSILLTITLFLTLLRNRKKTILKVLGVETIVFFICVWICAFLMYYLQINIATPYIEEALNQQCSVNEVSILDGVFHNDSRFRWIDANGEIECRFSNSEWECRC